MLHFAAHAEALYEPLVPPDARDDPIWKSLMKHLRIIRIMSQHAISRAQVVDELAPLIYEWTELFLSIDEYQDLFKPKGHMYAHYPADILNFGPTRQYWCMRFEAMNQFFKRVAMHGNFKNTLHRCAMFYMVRTGMLLKGEASDWSDYTAHRTSEPTSLTREFSRALSSR